MKATYKVIGIICLMLFFVAGFLLLILSLFIPAQYNYTKGYCTIEGSLIQRWEVSRRQGGPMIWYRAIWSVTVSDFFNETILYRNKSAALGYLNYAATTYISQAENDLKKFSYLDDVLCFFSDTVIDYPPTRYDYKFILVGVNEDELIVSGNRWTAIVISGSVLFGFPCLVFGLFLIWHYFFREREFERL
eukprot:TRINITY_DN728_c0_g1_i2.p1 TRINITY_DN728_c0_g1~~TRINITY_DN728_c0_g1_i2.p1  ORF type:complete len:190 (+),score=15.57 TRINITY_DN728_c0_g1_i2:103-672(+)